MKPKSKRPANKKVKGSGPIPEQGLTGPWGRWEVFQDWHTNVLTVPTLHAAIWNARLGDTRQLFAIYRDFLLGDPHIQGEFGKRKLAVLGDQLSVAPADSKNSKDQETADFVKKAIKGVKGWRTACAHLMDSSLWPVAVVEKVFRREGSGFMIDRLVVVPHMLLDFRGTTGSLRIRKQDEEGRPLEDFLEPDPERYIVHRGHLLSTPDQFGGPMRSILFWTLFMYMNREWWIRFLDRFGTPFPVGKFQEGDDGSRRILNQALSLSTRLGGLVVTRDTEIELHEANTANADAFKVFHEVACDEISKLIVGQTLSSKAKSTGLGSGVADLQAQVREDIRMFDAAMLLETLGDQLVQQLLDINGNMGDRPTMIWGSQSTADLKGKVGMIKDLAAAQIYPSDDALNTLSADIGFGLVRGAAPAVPSQEVGDLSADGWRYARRRANLDKVI